MGLSVQVGALAGLLNDDPEGAAWLLDKFEKINRLLQENGLPQHQEPRTLLALDDRAAEQSYPYSFIHHLRRVAAHQIDDPAYVAEPVEEGEDPADDPLLEDEYAMMRSHLICHSDAEGFYLPVDFEDILFDDRDEIPGGIVGSSLALLAELTDLAPALGISLDEGVLGDDEAARLKDDIETEEGIWIEKVVWLSLYESARLSVAHRTAILFG